MRATLLPANWWGGGGGMLAWTEVESLRDRYCVAVAAVRGLGVNRCREGRDIVKQFRDFGASLPLLKEIEQTIEECDRVLAELTK